MKIIQITYRTNAVFSEKNKENIKSVMTDLEKLKHKGINYNACLLADNQTFLHTAFFKTDDDQKILNELPSFKSFQAELKSSGLEISPKAEVLTIVGTSNNIF